ncbi:hypothetical protein [Nocardioides sp.]|uniref:hypothetical protein n=1 Tax=Nocardioides sp. TaxID=35761 RepID=UPI0037837B5B
MTWYVGLGVFAVVAIGLVVAVLYRRRHRPPTVKRTAHPRRNTGTEHASQTRHGSRERRERKRRRAHGRQVRRKRH